ncbi:fatty acid biosynthesis transcriptional regulator [Proteiniborus sp. DW1]|uniref:transcription factor FapR n=1 Tax=Proteiniborus sp. DW1 TaxID=1889883 RepID=UPI00092DEBB5|nr:transcription factor FapR [Proteiniborus sp. DW1]SCG83488.1 fatty acid biosynthesis transcriptional regulator [Proteiniborus sp. DW1]
MSIGKLSKKDRHKKLIEKLKGDPFLTDEELMQMFNVSIQTIRLDRLELGIPELRERIKNVAEKSYSKVRTIGGTEIVGELVDIDLGKKGISILETDESMAFLKTSVVRGHNIYAQAESLAIAVIDADVALTGVANVKYKDLVKAGEKLIAKAEVIRKRGNKYFVHVFTYVGQKQVFRGKFILVSIEQNNREEI